MSLDYIRNYYKVPAYKDVRIEWCNKKGTIKGADGPYIKVQFDGEKRAVNLHPIDNVKYEVEGANGGNPVSGV